MLLASACSSAIEALKEAAHAHAPAIGQVLIELLEPAVRAPVHALRLGRKAVVQSEQAHGKAASFLDPSAIVPTVIGGCQRCGLILAFVTGASAQPAPESRTTVKGCDTCARNGHENQCRAPPKCIRVVMMEMRREPGSTAGYSWDLRR